MNNKRDDSAKGVPTISCVDGDTLIELVYDHIRRTTALVVSRFGGLWNIEQEVTSSARTKLVPYSPHNNLIANECVLLPSAPEEYGLKPVLVNDVRAFIHRYVDLSPDFELVAAYYVLLSWVHDAFSDLPYLRFLGDYGTGKTRALLTVGSLCYKPFFASGASTVSPIFHVLDRFGGTLLLDEADMPYSDARNELVKILNNGTTKGLPVLRSVVNRHKEFNPYAFRVFGPKLIAAREVFQDQALESRFLTERTGTQTPRPDIPVHLPPAFKDEALALRNRLLHFRLCEFFRVKTNTTAVMPSAAPRANQMALPLLSLVDDACARSQIEAWLLAQNADAQTERRESIEGCVTAAIVTAFAESGDTGASVRAVTNRFNAYHAAEYGGPVSNRWIGHVIRRRLGLKTRKSRGTFVVPVEEWPRVIATAHRYGIETADNRTFASND